MLADVGMVKMYSKSAHVNDLGFAWTGPPCCMDWLPPHPPLCCSGVVLLSVCITAYKQPPPSLHRQHYRAV